MTGSTEQGIFDLVVVGCGVAGLSAAVAAAEAGARVVVLERAPREERGGQSRWTEAYLRMKSHTEVTDDFEAMLAENGAPPYLDPDLAQEVARGTEHRAGHARGGEPCPRTRIDSGRVAMTGSTEQGIFDLVVVGCGVAGLSAAENRSKTWEVPPKRQPS